MANTSLYAYYYGYGVVMGLWCWQVPDIEARCDAVLLIKEFPSTVVELVRRVQVGTAGRSSFHRGSCIHVLSAFAS